MNFEIVKNLKVKIEKSSSSSQSSIDNTITTFDSTNEKVKSFISNAKTYYAEHSSTIVDQYLTANDGNDQPNGYTINDLTSGMKIVVISENDGNGYVDNVTDTAYTVYNLIPNVVYRVLVLNSNGTFVKSYRLKDTCECRLLKYNGGVRNCRDIGGKEVSNGKIRYGLMYRGQRLYHNSKEEINSHDKMYMWNFEQIGTQIDMRYLNEEGSIPNNSQISSYTSLLKEYVSGGYTPYWKIESLSSENKAKILSVVQTAVDSLKVGKPIYFHCQSGADRTGTLASLLLGVCGASWVDIDIDYELTSSTTSRKRSRNEYELWKNYINSLDGTTTKDKFEKYFLSLGISSSDITLLRNALVESTTTEETTPGETPTEPTPSEPTVEKINLLSNAEISKEDNKRLNSSGSLSNCDGYTATGFIPVTKGDTLEFENFKVFSSSSLTGYHDGWTKVVVYDTNKSVIYNDNMQNVNRDTNNVELNTDGFITKLTLNQIGNNDLSSMAYIRFSTVLEDNQAIYKIGG